MKKYLAYKQSNIDWIGEIPEHWETLPNKAIFSLKKKQVGKKAYEYTLLSLTLNGVIKRDMENPQGKFPAEFDTYQEVKQGDFIFCFFDVEETPRAVGLSNFDGMITGAYTVLEANPNFDKGFLYYFYLNLDENKMLKPLYRGLRNTVPKESFFAFKTLIPPLHEQRAIAEFLDQKTAQIDKAIDLKKRQIALLKERRQGIIHEAVTGKGKGNEGMKNEGMKDSGVEWIGEIPKHWEVRRLKFLANLVSIKLLSKNSELSYIGMENIESWTGKHIATTSEVEGLASYFSKGDVLFGKLRPYLAKVYLASKEGICSTEFLVYRVGKDITNQYLQSLMLSFEFINVIDSSTYGSKMPRANSDFIGNQIIPLPPLSEQQEIVSYIESQNEKINRAIGIKEQEIEKLKEYKAVLIDSAVTGKVRVMKE